MPINLKSSEFAKTNLHLSYKRDLYTTVSATARVVNYSHKTERIKKENTPLLHWNKTVVFPNLIRNSRDDQN